MFCKIILPPPVLFINRRILTGASDVAWMLTFTVPPTFVLLARPPIPDDPPVLLVKRKLPPIIPPKPKAVVVPGAVRFTTKFPETAAVSPVAIFINAGPVIL